MDSSTERTLAAANDAALIVQRDTENDEITLFFETSDSSDADPEAATPLEIGFTYVPPGVSAPIPEGADLFEISVLPMRIEMARHRESPALRLKTCQPDWENVEQLPHPLPFVFVEARPLAGAEE